MACGVAPDVAHHLGELTVVDPVPGDARTTAMAWSSEMQLGPWEGLTETQVAQGYPNAHALWCTLPDRLVLEGRETLGALAERVNAAVGDAAHEPHPVLLMTHVAPIRVVMLAVLRLA